MAGAGKGLGYWLSAPEIKSVRGPAYRQVGKPAGRQVCAKIPERENMKNFDLLKMIWLLIGGLSLVFFWVWFFYYGLPFLYIIFKH
jgi:hypothetical protein